MAAAQRTRFVNARITTENPSQPFATAMIVEGENIAWVGDEADVPPALCATGDRVVDLGGARVIPGVIDAHMHVVTLANALPQISALPPSICSIEDLVCAIAERRAAQGPDAWVLGRGYDEALLAEHRSPTRWDLDRGCPDAPVAITRTCEHIRCVNSRALELAHITRDTPDPAGGRIERNRDGEPTGVLIETARDLVTPYLPTPSERDVTENLLELGQIMASQGIVAAADMCSLDGTRIHPALVRAARAGFKQDVADFVLWDHVKDDPSFALSPADLDRTRQIFTAGIKLLTDGSISGRTAWFYEPFAQTSQGGGRDGGECAPACGMPTCTDNDIADAIAFCERTGCQISLHAMGTRACDRAARMLSAHAPWLDTPYPCARIEHLTAPSPEAIDMIARHGIGIATQPIFPYAEIDTYLANLGPERTRACYPIKTLLDRGVLLCISTDAPATSWADPQNPFTNIKAAVTRRAFDGTSFNSDEAITVEQALALYTREAARIAGFERLGQLRAGYKASFAVLDQDLLRVSADTIDQAGVSATYIRGEKVWRA